jgi:type IV pilus assembly protein PilQ
MRNIKILFVSISIGLFFTGFISGQVDTSWAIRYDTISRRLRSLENIIPGLNEKITNSVTGVTINEFLRAIAISSGVNISIDPRLNFQVINNFNDVKVSDVLLFLCDQYKFDISPIGNIIVIKQLEKPVIQNKCVVQFDPISSDLSLDVEDEALGTLSQKITDATGRNVIPANGLFNQKINTYVQKMPIGSALDKLAYSNNLVLKSTEDGFYIIEKKPPEKVEIPTSKTEAGLVTSKTEKEGTYKLSVVLLGKDSLSLYAEKAPVSEVLKEVSIKSGNDYIMSTVPKGEVSMQINGARYQDILRSILSGTDHVFKKQGRIYIIGNKNSPDLMSQVLIQLQYRAVDSIMYIIPKDLIGNIDARVFSEQNSIMLSGPADKVAETEKFIQQIDRLVPVVSIEVMIIDYNTSYTVSTGITAGVGTSEAPPSSGKVFPSLDMNLSSQSINDLINRFNGFGWAKIGKVTPNFYVQLKAMESQGILNIRSTPILSTLNGHETRLSIGNIEYYLEEQFNIIGTQNPQSSKIQTYKPVEAALSVIITPIVSGDDQITLEIEVNQSDFTERISNTAPPGKVTRTFKSQIRVKNEEMILLGGLEENRDSKTGSGFPFLSRIPILKWIFSNKTEVKSKSKLNIFIKPTIIS